MSKTTHTITWSQFNKSTPVKDGQTVLEAALENQIPLPHACGGYCACTTCHILIQKGLESLSPIESEEQDRLSSKFTKEPKFQNTPSRLGCQSRVHGNITVEIVDV